MPNQKKGPPADEPMICFGGEWIPAHDVWKKMETTTVVVDAIARFNEHFPHLASADTRNVVPLVRQRLKDVTLRMPPRKSELPDLSGVATELLRAMPVEDVIDTLNDKHGLTLSLGQLIQLVGEKAYIEELRHEAAELEMNRISAEQTAQLWNDAGRPAPGGGLWSSKKIAALLAMEP